MTAHITYAPDGDDYAVCLQWPGRKPHELCRAVNAAVARHKASQRAKERGLTWGPVEVAEDPRIIELLGLSIRKLRKALESGDDDHHLEALRRAEKAGENRKGALDAIGKREATAA